MTPLEISLRLQRAAAHHSAAARAMRAGELGALDTIAGVDLVSPFERTAAAMYAGARLFYAVHAANAGEQLDQIVAHLAAHPAVGIWSLEPVAHRDRLASIEARLADLEDDRDLDVDLAAAVFGQRRRS